MKARPRKVPRVLVLGGGELGSGVCHRLARSAIIPFIVDLERPTCIRRNVCFAMARTEGVKSVEGVAAERAASMEQALEMAGRGRIPVLAWDVGRAIAAIKPDVIVDARMLKHGQGMSRDMAPLVVGLGPGFVAGKDVHAVVETNRGHDLGKTIYDGSAETDTGVPAEIRGVSARRVVRSPGRGVFRPSVPIGRVVSEGEVLGAVGTLEVISPTDGMVRGLIADGTAVGEGMKIGDVDPRGSAIDPGTISDKARAVAGGVLEAVMHWWLSADHD